jgi:hypothetical protein
MERRDIGVIVIVALIVGGSLLWSHGSLSQQSSNFAASAPSFALIPSSSSSTPQSCKCECHFPEVAKDTNYEKLIPLVQTLTVVTNTLKDLTTTNHDAQTKCTSCQCPVVSQPSTPNCTCPVVAASKSSERARDEPQHRSMSVSDTLTCELVCAFLLFLFPCLRRERRG